MNRLSSIAVFGSLAGLVACGDGVGPVVERNNGGTGTTTLRVTADIDAQDMAGGLVADFRVTVRDGQGRSVSRATVTIRNDELGEITLLEVDPGSGVYTAERNTFSNKDFELDVVSGEDRVENVVAGSPGIHTIIAPAVNDTVTALEALLVTWKMPSQARGATVETRDYGSGVLSDNGEALIPADENPNRTAQRVRVIRLNEVDILGGLPGSRLRVEIRREVEPYLVRSLTP